MSHVALHLVSLDRTLCLLSGMGRKQREALIRIIQELLLPKRRGRLAFTT